MNYQMSTGLTRKFYALILGLCFSICFFISCENDITEPSTDEEIAIAERSLPEDDVLKEAEVMPQFPGCETIEDKTEQTNCAQKKMLEFIYSRISYPEVARENEIEGMVLVSFIVEKDGSISSINSVREVAGGCTEEALRVVNEMPNWHPGYEKDEPVRVKFHLPIKFKLQNPEK